MSLRSDPIAWLEDLWYRYRPRGDALAFLEDGLRDLPRGARILDFGSGTGAVADALSRRLAGGLVLADVDPSALADAPARFRRVVVPERGRLPFGADAFDAAFLLDVLHHLERPLDTLRELGRILVPDGRLLLVEYDRAQGAARTLAWACRWLRGHRLLTRSQIQALCRRAGFRAQVRRLDDLRVAVHATAEPSPGAWSSGRMSLGPRRIR